MFCFVSFLFLDWLSVTTTSEFLVCDLSRSDCHKFCATAEDIISEIKKFKNTKKKMKGRENRNETEHNKRKIEGKKNNGWQLLSVCMQRISSADWFLVIAPDSLGFFEILCDSFCLAARRSFSNIVYDPFRTFFFSCCWVLSLSLSLSLSIFRNDRLTCNMLDALIGPPVIVSDA